MDFLFSKIACETFIPFSFWSKSKVVSGYIWSKSKDVKCRVMFLKQYEQDKGKTLNQHLMNVMNDKKAVEDLLKPLNKNTEK